MTREAETLTGKFMVVADLQQPLELWATPGRKTIRG